MSANNTYFVYEGGGLSLYVDGAKVIHLDNCVSFNLDGGKIKFYDSSNNVLMKWDET